MKKAIKANNIINQIEALNSLDIDYDLKVKVYNELGHGGASSLNQQNLKKKFEGETIKVHIPELPNEKEGNKIIDGFKKSKYDFTFYDTNNDQK